MSIRYKLTLSITGILLLVMVSAMLLEVYELNANYDQNLKYARGLLVDAQKIDMKNITVAAASIFDYFNAQVKEGKLSLEDAQAQARELFRVVRYDTENKALKGGNYFWIDTAEGDNVLHPITPQIEGKNRIKARDANNMEMIRAIIESGLRGGDFTEFFYEKPGEKVGKQKIGYSIEYKPWRWVIGTGFWVEDWDAVIEGSIAGWKEEAKASIDRLMLYSVLTLGILLLVVLVFTLSYTKRFVRPIVKLSGLAAEMAGGNLHIDIDVDDEPSGDEMGVLRKSIKDMARSLSVLLQQVNDSSEELFEASGVLSSASEQSAGTAEQVVTIMEDVAKDAQTQMDAVRSMTEAIEEIGGGIDNVASISASVSEKSAQTSLVAEEGNQSLSEAMTQMTNISETTKQTAGAIKSLGEKSKRINEIVELISAVSSQTNLLALNAAIEAARAGDQGRGFAVVAEEVRKLAEESRQATERITAEILEIQRDTDAAVELMTVGVAESGKGVEAVSRNGEMLRKIISNITDLHQGIQRITSVTQELAGSSGVVRSSVKELGDICAKTSEAAKNITAATQAQSAGIAEITNSSKGLFAIAGNMQKQVAKYGIHEVKWSPELETGNADIDAQHKQLIEMTGGLLKACLRGENPQTLTQTLDFLAGYTVRHFADEEKLQLSSHYPDYQNHRKLHDAFKATVTDLIAQYRAKGSSLDLSGKINSVIVRWLIQHIKQEDSKIAEHIRRKG